MSHTKEPWSVRERGDYGSGPEADLSVEKEDSMRGYMSLDDALRIVACVNACAGLETEMLISLVADGTTLQNIMRRGLICLEQRDELLAALEEICWSRPLGFRETKYSFSVETIATRAISRVKASE